MAAISEIAASNHQTVGPRPARAAKRRSKRRPKAVKRRSKSGQMAVKKGVGRSRTISPEVRPRANDRARGGQKLSKWSKSGQKLVKVVKRPFRHQAAGQAATGTAPKRHHEKRPKENGQRKMVKGKWPKENGQNDGRKGGPGRRRRRSRRSLRAGRGPCLRAGTGNSSTAAGPLRALGGPEQPPTPPPQPPPPPNPPPRQ